MEYSVKSFNEGLVSHRFSRYVLGGDIGGTFTNLGVAGVRNGKPVLLFSLNFSSKALDSLVPAVEATVAYARNKFGVEVESACIGAAGVVSPGQDAAELTNVSWDVSSAELMRKTSLQSVYVLNDFQAVGFGVNLLDGGNYNDLFQVREGKGGQGFELSTRAVIGAGTGFGKSILVYDEDFQGFIPIPSEGGHGDFPVQSDLERELEVFVKRLRGISQPLCYEEVLSGRGLESIYLFFRDTEFCKESQYTREIDGSDEKAFLISKYRQVDGTCKETFRLFTRFYARCAKNFVLDTFAQGGLYIAGGIAAKNKEIFISDDFLVEFDNAFRRGGFLQRVPIYVVVNYDVSLYGACYAALYYFLQTIQ